MEYHQVEYCSIVIFNNECHAIIVDIFSGCTVVRLTPNRADRLDQLFVQVASVHKIRYKVVRDRLTVMILRRATSRKKVHTEKTDPK
jgi:hypothetical protein